MAHRSTLVGVSSAQLAAQLAGHLVALRRRRHFDGPFLTGSPEHIVRDWLWFGTAYSARGLTLGHLTERCSRLRIRPGGFDPVETPVVVGGWGCAAAMAVLARD